MQGIVGAKRVEDRVEGFGAEIVDPLQRRRRRQQAEMVGAFRQQAVDERGIDAIGREHRVGDALRRILIVVETGGAEREVEIGDDGIQREIARDRPGDVVRDGGRADAALGADDGDDAADGLGLRRREQIADRTHHVERVDRRDHVVADAAAHQFAIKRDVVDPADHDDPGSGIADGGELIETGEDIGAAFGFQDDHVRRRRGAIGLDGGRHAAHLDLEMGLAEAAVFARRLHGGSGFHRLAERLHRYTRRRRDVIVRGRRCDVRLLFGILSRVADHLPVSLSLALSASG